MSITRVYNIADSYKFELSFLHNPELDNKVLFKIGTEVLLYSIDFFFDFHVDVYSRLSEHFSKKFSRLLRGKGVVMPPSFK